eukprot:1155115-Pelagomonas_calceolata.AAC.4
MKGHCPSTERCSRGSSAAAELGRLRQSGSRMWEEACGSKGGKIQCSSRMQQLGQGNCVWSAAAQA